MNGGQGRNKKRKALLVTSCSFHAEGCRVFLDEFDTKKQAYDALHQAAMEHADYGIEEVELDG